MSRFFRGDSDSDSDSSSSSSSSFSSEDDVPAARQQAPAPTSRYVFSDEEGSDDVKRVVKSAKDKRFEELRACVKSLDNAKKINDWVALSNEFDRLLKLIQKAQSVIMTNGKTPLFFIRTLMQLEDVVKETLDHEKEQKKKMNTMNSKAFNAMRQKLKKNNKAYEEDIEQYRKNPVLSEASASSSESASDAEPQAKKTAVEPKRAKFQKKADDDDGESTDSYFGSDVDESSSESSMDENMPKGRARWLKRDADAEKPKEFKKVVKKAPRPAAKLEGREDDDQDAAAKEEAARKGKLAVVYTSENLIKKLREVIDARGKKSTDRLEQIQILQELLKVAATPYQKIRVILVLLASQFDQTSIKNYLNIDTWKSAEEHINILLSVLEETGMVIREDAPEPDDTDNTELTEIRGSVGSFVDRLDDEFIKSLQHLDPHSTEYVDRLKDETALYATIVRTQAYLKKHGTTEAVCQMVMHRLEHVYYKPDQVVSAVEDIVKRQLSPQEHSVVSSTSDPEALIHNLCVSLYNEAPPLLRTRAVLCHIYHHALHNRYHAARDLLLMSHLQESIHQADILTQILYNRALVQLGLCAFRLGMVKETQSSLQEIMNSGRVKELLAQGTSQRMHSAEQEKVEKQRQLPFHMHVNLELLECVYLVCSMLLEVPVMAQSEGTAEARKRIISKLFRRMLDNSERMIFVGPPENTREHVIAASKALMAGEWSECQHFIKAIKIWDLMPNAASIKEMLCDKIQQEALRTYLFTYGPFYTTMRLDHLASMFGMTEHQVRKIVSGMIYQEELTGSLDQVNALVVLTSSEPSRLQQIAVTLADKVSFMVDMNEKVMESKLGSGMDVKADRDTAMNPSADRKGGDRKQQKNAGNRQKGGRRNVRF